MDRTRMLRILLVVLAVCIALSLAAQTSSAVKVSDGQHTARGLHCETRVLTWLSAGE